MGFGEQIAGNPLFGAVSEDFFTALSSLAVACDFEDFKFHFGGDVAADHI